MEKKINKTQKKANKVKVEANFLFVIAITATVTLILNLLAAILHNVQGGDQASEIFDYLSAPAGVATIVFIILNFTKWNIVRDQTKVNYRLVLIPYIITLAIDVALGVVLYTYLINAKNESGYALAHTIIHAVSLPVDLFLCIYSFILQTKVRQYAK